MKNQLILSIVMIFAWSMPGFTQDPSGEQEALLPEGEKALEIDPELATRGATIAVLPEFDLISNAKTKTRVDLELAKVSVNQCAKICLSLKNRYCHAFNYLRNAATCEITFSQQGPGLKMANNWADLYIRKSNSVAETEVHRIPGPLILNVAYEHGYFNFPCIYSKEYKAPFPCARPSSGTLKWDAHGRGVSVTISGFLTQERNANRLYYFYHLKDPNGINRHSNAYIARLKNGWTLEDVNFSSSHPITWIVGPKRGSNQISMQGARDKAGTTGTVALNWVELRGPKGENWIKAFCDDC